MTKRALLFLVVVSASVAHAQRRVPLELDGGYGNNPTQTSARLATMTAAMPAYYQLPASYPSLLTGPDNAARTVWVWLPPEIRDQYDRAAASGTAAMQWPAPVLCARHAAFVLPASLLAAGAAPSCSTHESTVRSALTSAVLTACLEVEEPERYVVASRAPSTLGPNDQNGRTSFADSHTQTLEDQIAFAGAAFGTVPVPAGLLPADFVPAMRKVLWKIRPATATTGRVQTARQGFASALSTLNAQAACFESAFVTQVTALDGELAALGAHVTQVISDGTARAIQQQQCLGARSRVRPALQWPALTDEEREQIGFWLGGVYWRMRGGGVFSLAGATQSSRKFYAQRPFKEIARVASGTSSADRQPGERAADAIYCGLGDGWGSWFDMGTYMNPSAPAEDNMDFYADLVGMTNRGRQHTFDFPSEARLFCIGQGIFNVDKPPEEYLRDDNYDTQAFGAGGMSMGPCYAYALNPMKNFRWFDSVTAPAPYTNFIEGHTTMGEFCIGAAMGQGLVRSLLNGKPSGMPAQNFCAGRQCGVDQCGTSCGACMSGMTCDASGQCISGGTGGGASGAGGGAAGGSAGGSAGGQAGGGENTGGGSGGSGGSGGGESAGGGGGSGGSAGGTSGTGGGAPGGGSPDPEPRGCGCGSTPPLAEALFALVLISRRDRRRRP